MCIRDRMISTLNITHYRIQIAVKAYFLTAQTFFVVIIQQADQCPSCQRNSAVRRNRRVRISQRNTFAHWLHKIGDVYKRQEEHREAQRRILRYVLSDGYSRKQEDDTHGHTQK